MQVYDSVRGFVNASAAATRVPTTSIGYNPFQVLYDNSLVGSSTRPWIDQETQIPQDAHASHVPTIHDEITELAHGLVHDEPCMRCFEATCTAGQMIEELEAYVIFADRDLSAALNS
ncbi:MAG TPA: hypothetical protein VFZ66_25150 [Herpetosiphonaceae bacterium]